MSLKERFTHDEWHQLKLLPIRVFTFTFLRLAKAHPEAADTQLARVFVTTYGSASSSDALLNELLEDTPQAELTDLIGEAAGSDIVALLEPMERVAVMLSRELSRKEYNAFMVAVVSGVGLQPFLGLADEARDVALDAQRDLEKVLGIDWQAGIRAIRAQQRTAR